MCYVCGKKTSHYPISTAKGIEEICHDCANTGIHGKTITFCHECGTLSEVGVKECQDCHAKKTNCDICGGMHTTSEITFEDKKLRACKTCATSIVKCATCGKAMFKKDGDEVAESFYHKTCEHPVKFPGPNECSFGSDLKVGFEQELTGIKPKDYSVSFSKAGPYHLFSKHDRSVDRGGEIVTSPFDPDQMDLVTARVHMAKVDALKVSDRAIEANDSTGFHVHVNRGYLTPKQWNKVLRFVTGNFMFAILSGRRNAEKLAQYASLKKQSKSSDQSGRYYALNFQNSGTVEFRLFQSTTDHRDMVGMVHLVTAIVKMTKNEVPLTNLGLYRYAKKHYSLAARYYKKMVHARNMSYSSAKSIV